MNKVKFQQNIFSIIFNSIILYFKNILPLTRVMLFPVFGQILGIVLILGPTFLLTTNINRFMPQYQVANNIILIFTVLLLIIIPGFFVFTKAFWEYMIAMISLNVMSSEIIKKGSLKDTKTPKQMVRMRSKDYVMLLLLLSLVWLVGLSIPLLIFPASTILNLPKIALVSFFTAAEMLCFVILIIVSIYLSLSYQVFSFESISPVKVMKKSWKLVEGNFWRTFIFSILVGILTGSIIPGIFQFVIDNSQLINVIVAPFNTYVSSLINNPIVSQQLATQRISVDIVYMIPKTIALSAIGMLITALLLPFNSLCYTMLYFDIMNRVNFNNKKKK